MPRTILCLYIETDDVALLGNLLCHLGVSFYDATHLDPMTCNGNFHTLDEIEAALEGK